MGYVEQRDLEEDAVALLLPQFRNSPDLNNFIKALVGGYIPPYQDLFDIMRAFDLRVATGKTLDLLGKLLNTSREGLQDEDYRNRLIAVVIINGSTGTPENLITNLNTIVGEGNYKLIESFPAEVQVRLYLPQSVLTAEILDKMLPIGVNGVFFENPYTGKVVWELSEVDADGSISQPNPLSILPDVADVATSNVVLIDIIFT
tara:strand:- start:1155 stop:1763 length:609 start_codon:yes stop_codon:yes gene_type:complete